MSYQYKLKVAGVTFENRQSILGVFKDAGWVQGRLSREEGNIHDVTAVAVYIGKWEKEEKVGYLPRECSQKWFGFLKSEEAEHIIVRCRVIGGGDGKNLGCSVFVQTREPVGEPTRVREAFYSESREGSDLLVKAYAESTLSEEHPGVWCVTLQTRDGKYGKSLAGECNDLVAARVLDYALPKALDSIRNGERYQVDVLYGGRDVTEEGRSMPLSKVSEGFLSKRYSLVFKAFSLRPVESVVLYKEKDEARQLLTL